MSDPNADDANMKSSGKTVGPEEQNPFLQGMAHKKKRPRWFWPAILIGAALTITYLLLVFIVGFEHGQSQGPSLYIPKPGWSLPSYQDDFPKECAPIFVRTTLTPYTDGKSPHEMHQFSEYRSKASVWLLNPARTKMYEAELLKYPQCLQFRLQEMAATKNRLILVIYDKATKSEVLVIRNYP